jgi:hypothetical protein
LNEDEIPEVQKRRTSDQPKWPIPEFNLAPPPVVKKSLRGINCATQTDTLELATDMDTENRETCTKL